MVLRRAVRLGFLPSVCLFFMACLSPTLPVPPPSEPNALQEPLARLLPGGKSMQIDGSDAQPGALITLWNEETQSGTVLKATDRGFYAGVLGVDVSCAQQQNHIELFQTNMEGKNSEVKTYRLPNHVGDMHDFPPDAACADGGADATSMDAGADVVTNEGGDAASE